HERDPVHDDLSDERVDVGIVVVLGARDDERTVRGQDGRGAADLPAYTDRGTLSHDVQDDVPGSASIAQKGRSKPRIHRMARLSRIDENAVEAPAAAARPSSAATSRGLNSSRRER